MTRKAAAYPYIGWMIIFILIPLFLILFYSFTSEVDGKIIFTLDHLTRFFEPIYLKVLWRSFKLAFFSTVLCLVIGYPLAYILAENEFKRQNVILFLLIAPMWMNFLLRTYAWLTILERNGALNIVLNFFGLPKQKILYTDAAVMLGMVCNFLPFMILPIYTVLNKMDESIIEAAQDLGADSLHVFTRVVFPMSLPGVISGITMVFMPAVTTFVISNLLGGGQYMLVGNLIEFQYLHIGDWNFGAAISLILLLIIIGSSVIFSLVDKNDEGGALL